MKTGRTLAPAVTFVSVYDVLQGLKGLYRADAAIEDFSEQIRAHFNVRHCFLISSGRAALVVILRALHALQPGRDQVLIPAFTCYSVPSGIVRAGLKVRLADVNPETQDFDVENLKDQAQYQDRLLAVVCPHLFGLPADMDTVQSVLSDPEIALVEDAAQAMGTAAGKNVLGTLGDVGFFSLGRGKAFTTVEGGIIVVNNEKIAQQIRIKIHEIASPAMLDHFKTAAYALALSILMRPSLFWIPKSIPALKLGQTIYDPGFAIHGFSAFQAGLAGNWQKRLYAMQQARKDNTAFWQKHLQGFDWLQPIPAGNGSKAGALPLIRYPVLVKNSGLRQRLIALSEKNGLGIMPSYPDSIDSIKELEIVNPEQDFPGAKQCAGRLVTFPVHGFVTQKDRRKILNCLKAMDRSGSRS
jgi:dTDP-4-amino-4,6-dideoxygalactose transaminase